MGSNIFPKLVIKFQRRAIVPSAISVNAATIKMVPAIIRLASVSELSLNNSQAKIGTTTILTVVNKLGTLNELTAEIGSATRSGTAGFNTGRSILSSPPGLLLRYLQLLLLLNHPHLHCCSRLWLCHLLLVLALWFDQLPHLRHLLPLELQLQN